MNEKMPYIDDGKDFKYSRMSPQCTFCENQLYPRFKCEVFGEAPLKYWNGEEECPHKNTLTPEQWKNKHGVKSTTSDEFPI